MSLTSVISGATRTLRAVAVGAMTALLPFGAASGQQGQPPEVTVITAEGAGSDFDTRDLQRGGFDLFASGDAAFSGMRATGAWGTALTNYGDCNGTLRNCQGNTINVDGTFRAPYFEVEWAYGVPPSQFVKIRNVAPSVSNATGGGFMAAYNRTVLGGPKRMGPSDGTLGVMFSGVTNTTDGSCRDHTGRPNGRYDNSGLQLLPTSDCSETWGSQGWMGAHPISAEGYKALFDAQGADFTWDFWQVPEQYQSLDKPFLGTRHHTYGETTDYMADVLNSYGSVIPGGTGGPVFQGFPLGLKINFEAFNFAVPTVNAAYFVQVTIVNRSEDLWGAPIDYDSLYFGFSTGTLFSSQTNSRYAMPELGMVLHHQNNVQGAGGPCDDASRAPYSGWSCLGNSASTRGYLAGATGLIMLKSPLGDMRNKLFTRTVAGTPCTPLDPFCAPGHPLAGDTLTFNRQAFGDYGGADAFTWSTNAQASFGYLSATEANTLAGRSIADFNERTQYSTFRSELWPATKDHHNKYVPPGGWDYNKDGILDTLAMDTCGQFGCAVADSDTMPGGWLNRRGNIGGLMSFGPISLKAGDTTSVIYAHVGDADSARFWAQVNAVMDLYLNFYLSPESPPVAEIVSTQITPGTDAFGTINPEVALFFSDAPERWTDPFLTKLAADVETSPAFASLLALNPWLPDSLRARAVNNFEQLEIYKSCDGGDSFTADNDCDGDQATRADGSADVFGWRAYSILPGGATGSIQNTFTDGNVDGGRTYLYALIGKSRGASYLLNTSAGPDTVRFAPEIRNPLSRSTSDPNVVSVYIPASKPAGYVAAAVAFTTMPTSTTPFSLSLSDNVVSASYRAVFGNEILVARDSNQVTNDVPQSIVTVRRHETVDDAGVGVDSVIRTEAFTYANDLTFLVEGTGTAGGSVTVGDIITTTTTYGAPNTCCGFVLARTDGTPIFGSTSLVADEATPAELLSRDEYPGFTVEADNSVAGTHDQDAEVQYRGAETLAEQNLQPSDSIAPRGLVNSFMVQWRETSATRPNTTDGVGGYDVAWADDPFGVVRGFTLNLTNPAATEAEVQAALAARTLPTVGLTDAATAALMGVDPSDLVPVKVPATIRNTTFDRPVNVAMVRRLSDRILLGDGGDTISVEVQPDQWVPGDGLYFIEDIVEDSTIGGRLVLSGGQPVQTTRTAVTFSRAVLGCNDVRESCNPVVQQTAGASGYDPFRNGDITRFAYYVGFSPTTEYVFDVTAATAGTDITAVTDSALALIRVVPNPFVIWSAYQTTAAEGRLLFTNLPSQGTLRVYTVAGQFVQQINWIPDDLEGDGDLLWDMRTREGIDIASGLYIWVVNTNQTPTDASTPSLTARGKFVVIRGDSR